MSGGTGRSINKGLSFGAIVSSRQFFNPAHAVGAREEIGRAHV
jgi:hypothetical protein